VGEVAGRFGGEVAREGAVDEVGLDIRECSAGGEARALLFG